MDYYYGNSEKDCFAKKGTQDRVEPSRQAANETQPLRSSDQVRVETNSGGQFQSPTVQPTFDSEEMRGSMQQILAENVGEYVVIEFLIGTERLMRKQGLLYFVGRSYVTLYDDTVRNYIVCDLFSIKFVYFYYPGDRPRRNFNILPNVNSPGNNSR